MFQVTYVKNKCQDFPAGPVLRLRVPNVGDLDLVPGQEARSHMPTRKEFTYCH